MQVILEYIREGTSYLRTFNLLVVKGFDVADEAMLERIKHLYLTGTLEEEIMGFHKVIELGFGERLTAAEQRFLTRFYSATWKGLYYGLYYSKVVNEDDSLVSTWESEAELGRSFTCRFLSTNVFGQWDTLIPVEDDDMPYLKLKVKVEGTESSPEQFTTNVGKLLTQENTESFPTFNDTTHVFAVMLGSSKYQQAGVSLTDVPTVSGGNLTWYAFHDDMGAPASDGFYYCDVVIFIKARPTA